MTCYGISQIGQHVLHKTLVVSLKTSLWFQISKPYHNPISRKTSKPQKNINAYNSNTTNGRANTREGLRSPQLALSDDIHNIPFGAKPPYSMTFQTSHASYKTSPPG